MKATFHSEEVDLVMLGGMTHQCYDFHVQTDASKGFDLAQVPTVTPCIEAPALMEFQNIHAAIGMYIPTKRGAEVMKDVGMFCMQTGQSVAACLSFISHICKVVGHVPPLIILVRAAIPEHCARAPIL